MTVNNSNVFLRGVIQTPSTLTIDAIDQSNPMKVTVSVDSVTASNTYIAGQLVKLFIPFDYGMQQANGLVLKIKSVSGDFIYLDINAKDFDPFAVPLSGTMPASLAPAGSRNLSYSNTTDGVPFQSLNNNGN